LKFIGALLALLACSLCAADLALKQPNRFEESSYGNSRYQIFEVHNHYQGKGHAYLPPQAQPQQQHVVPGNDDNLDVSFLSFADDGRVQPLPVAQPLPIGAAPGSVPVPFPSNYQHDFQRKQAPQPAVAYRSQAYLPPTVATPNLQLQQQQQQQQQQAYHLEQQQQQQQQEQQQLLQQQQSQLVSKPVFSSNDYLPPTTAAATAASIVSYPQQQQLQQQQQQQQLQQLPQQQQVYRAPSYAVAPAADYRAPGYLPPGYDFDNPDHLPLDQIIEQPQLPAVQPTATVEQQQQQLNHPGALPEGYEFSKPENFEAAIAELHSLQTQTKLLKQQQQQQQQLQLQQQQQQQQQLTLQQQQQRSAGSNIIYGVPKQQQVRTTATATATTTALRATAVATPAVVAAPLPAPPTQHTHIHALRSYMNTVQPYARYGQPQQQQLLQQRVQQQQFVEVAPMHREQSKRPRFYAPAMSYARNALPTQYHQHHHIYHAQRQQQQQQQPLPLQLQLPRPVLNLQAQQSLQKFMPREMQLAVNVAVAAAGPVARGSSKVRTVQIVKQHAVRTFKVLETLDAAGVKTIKILGTSNEQPRGHHHIVKVVTQDANNVESHVQTVKIYDDQQEYQQQQLPTGAPRGYLPPTVARPRARIVRQTRPLRLLPVPRR
ncbi:putative mediator of RNA polymerase II transcription subunit 12, partial [Drosophila hydei]|uniref:Mediator of RNA polymerase II transcription subunit 12 n=1 Tax=Drosophila hydei TaxID=7224 RepID=A0A6J2STK6_DROHY